MARLIIFTNSKVLFFIFTFITNVGVGELEKLETKKKYEKKYL